MPRQEYIDITIVLDRSGSMDILRSDTIGGFNALVADQKKAQGIGTLTLAQFNDEYELTHCGKPLKEVPPLTGQSYVPKGWTALLDAIGRTLTATRARIAAMPDAEKPARTVFIIITDGHENASREFNNAHIREMIEAEKKNGWEFVFLGAQLDAFDVGMKLGTPVANVMQYAANKVGTDQLYKGISDNLLKYRGGGAQGMAFTADDRAAQASAGASAALPPELEEEASPKP